MERPMQRRPQANGVFFTGVPLFVEHKNLRLHFESIGHVVDFKMFDLAPGKDFRHGLVYYMDDKTAAEAIRRLNGTTFGEKSMRVSAAADRSNTRKRRRDHTDQEGRGLMMFPRGFMDSVLGREDSLVLDCLRGLSTEEAYEAVEQLRVLALERRQDAKALLQENPALRSAVVMILQHAGRVPNGALPPEAFQSAATVGSSASVVTHESEITQGKSATTDAQREEVMQLIGNMSEEDVDRILNMSADDLKQVQDPVQRRQLEILRDRLLEMSNGL